MTQQGGKLPRREELLNNKTTKVETPQSGESSEVQKAKNDADIAAANFRKTEAEINTKIKQEGFQSIADGLTKVKERLDQADQVLSAAQSESQKIAEERATLEEEKQKVIDIANALKQKEKTVDGRLEEAIRLEQSRKEKVDGLDKAIAELKELQTYHLENIEPCRKALANIAKSIYNFAGILDQKSVVFVPLYNYIGKSLTFIDKYVSKEVTPVLPETVIEVEKVEESTEPIIEQLDTPS